MTPDTVLVICGAVVALAIVAVCAAVRLAAAATELAEAVRDYLDGSG